MQASISTGCSHRAGLAQRVSRRRCVVAKAEATVIPKGFNKVGLLQQQQRTLLSEPLQSINIGHLNYLALFLVSVANKHTIMSTAAAAAAAAAATVDTMPAACRMHSISQWCQQYK
jgi:hypothetical protein